MIFKNLSDETRFGLLFIISLLALLIVMLLLNIFLGGNEKSSDAEKTQQKTVIVTEAEKNADTPVPLPKSVVSTVRDALKQGKYSTAVMVINNVPKSSPEYEELKKQLADATRQRKTPGVRKDAGASPDAPVRYFDESTPRNRTVDALYIYFVDVSGVLVPRFCIQAAAKRPLEINRFTINADGKKFEIMAPPIKVENTENGIAEIYDVPLDRKGYGVSQAVIKAKSATLVIAGSNGTKSHNISDAEKKGFSRILKGFAALGGSLNYLQETRATPAASQKNRTK